jgi:hypothetical protein
MFSRELVRALQERSHKLAAKRVDETLPLIPSAPSRFIPYAAAGRRLPLTPFPPRVILNGNRFADFLAKGSAPMRCLVVPAFALLLAFPAFAQDKAAPKKGGGLNPGDEVPGTFEPYNVNGKYKGRFHCLVTQNGLNPVAALFVRGIDDLEVVGTLLQKLDEAVKKNEKSRLASFAVFVDEQLPDVVSDDEKREATAKKLDDIGGKLERVVLALANPKSLDKYRLDPDAEITLVLYNKLKVVEVKTLSKGKLNKDTIAALVTDVVTKLTKK